MENRVAYRPELDGLRAIAAIYVVLFHLDSGGFWGGGFVGVDIFFVLSGFLITSILAAEFRTTGRIDLSCFYLRRTLRLVPALFLMLGCYVVVAPFVWPGFNHNKDALIAATYVSNYIGPRYISHTWTLALEEQFYLLWPLILPLAMLSRRPALWLLLAWAAITVWRNVGIVDTGFYFRFETRASGLALGAAIAFLPKISLSRPIVALLALACLLGNTSFPNATITLAEVATALVIADPPKWLGERVLTQIGKLSYGIYLWHLPIIEACRPHLSFAALFAVTIFLSVLFAYLSSVTVERWGRALRDTRYQSKSAAAQALGGRVAS